MACPPCSGNCVQGRDCPARQADVAAFGDPDEDNVGGLDGIEKATVVSAVIFGLCVLGALLTLAVKGCTA